MGKANDQFCDYCESKIDIQAARNKDQKRKFIAYGCYYGHCLYEERGGYCGYRHRSGLEYGCNEKTNFSFYLTASEYCLQFGHQGTEKPIPGTFDDDDGIDRHDYIIDCKRCGYQETGTVTSLISKPIYNSSGMVEEESAVQTKYSNKKILRESFE